MEHHVCSTYSPSLLSGKREDWSANFNSYFPGYFVFVLFYTIALDSLYTSTTRSSQLRATAAVTTYVTVRGRYKINMTFASNSRSHEDADPIACSRGSFVAKLLALFCTAVERTASGALHIASTPMSITCLCSSDKCEETQRHCFACDYVHDVCAMHCGDANSA